MPVSPAAAQWVTQSIELSAGWNAVYLEVQPDRNDCDALFTHPDIESVWQWHKRYREIQFESDPTTPSQEATHWLTWLPASHPQSFVRNLFKVFGGQAYLIRIREGADAFVLPVTGRPVIPRIDWRPGYLQLVGFPVNPMAPPNFADFLAHTEAIDASARSGNLFRIDAAGAEREILLPSRDDIQSGSAYWVRCREPSDFVAPIQVKANVAGRIDFQSIIGEQSLVIRNDSPDSTLAIQVRQLPSEQPPSGVGAPELAGGVPMSYFDTDGMPDEWGWEPLPGLIEKSLEPGEAWTLQLAVRRGDMPDVQPLGSNGVVYAALLEVTESSTATRYLVPVSAQKDRVSLRTAEAARLGAPPQLGALTMAQPFEGLWVGEARLNAVNVPYYGVTDPVDTSSVFPVRLIVHVDYTNQVRLLHQVLLAWDGTSSNYVLYADESLIPPGANGEVHRINSVSFPLMEPVELIGDLTNSLTGSVHVPFEDPTSPFQHRFHNNHSTNNPIHRIDVTRDISMVFTNDLSVPNPFRGIEEVAGTYREELGGLREDVVVVRGPFVLQRISTIGDMILQP